jgi:hypothetical protein
VTHASPLNGCGIGCDSDHVLEQACRTDCCHDSVQIGHDHVGDYRRRDAHVHSRTDECATNVHSRQTPVRHYDWADVGRDFDLDQQKTLCVGVFEDGLYCRVDQFD